MNTYVREFGMKDSEKLLSVIIPAHNEEAGIQHAIEEIFSVLRKCPIKYEIIIVDDGSIDKTYAKVCKLI